MLDGVNVALGVTGSIAAVKTVELAHELRREGATVRAVMSDAATGIIGPWSLEFATENEVVTGITGKVEHVELCGRDGWADVFLVAPATANTVGKMAAGIDDTPVTTCATTALGAGIPTVVAPAMHEPMYDHPAVPEKLATLEEWGVETVDPRLEEGKAKIATEAAIVTSVARAAGKRPLAGKTVVVTAGGTTEKVDPVRSLTNQASGKTGRAVARACHIRGADVHLIHGDMLGDRPDTHYAETTWVGSVAELQEATFDAVADADAFVSAAAVSDYTLEASSEKIRSGEEELTITLRPTPKLVDAVRERYPDLTLVGFKAETGGDDEALVEQARSLRERINAAFVVANDASVMGKTKTRALVVDAEASSTFEGEKGGLGLVVADRLAAVLA
ncbi:bifunctional phosphopantothenoylcysteine decarboxylase/phosphopantothenate--cysteine ligase CoaBC [Halolamina sp.]|uniref:bifunctional phosphopantothenoylcysteine decarboxylase/phosphopantothenate--cysteine ligase CoaBC n=1 Tax=Halolamina sp. TaxID=1940283 RepID=UPI003567590F